MATKVRGLPITFPSSMSEAEVADVVKVLHKGLDHTPTTKAGITALNNVKRLNPDYVVDAVTSKQHVANVELQKAVNEALANVVTNVSQLIPEQNTDTVVNALSQIVRQQIELAVVKILGGNEIIVQAVKTESGKVLSQQTKMALDNNQAMQEIKETIEKKNIKSFKVKSPTGSVYEVDLGYEDEG